MQQTPPIETVYMIGKGRVRWLAKQDAPGQALFIAGLFGLAAYIKFKQVTNSRVLHRLSQTSQQNQYIHSPLTRTHVSSIRQEPRLTRP